MASLLMVLGVIQVIRGSVSVRRQRALVFTLPQQNKRVRARAVKEGLVAARAESFSKGSSNLQLFQWLCDFPGI